MKLNKAERMLNFKKLDQLKKYINFSTGKKNAANTFEKHSLKLMNNRVYAKAMKNLRKRKMLDELIMLKTIKYSEQIKFCFTENIQQNICCC